MLLCSKRVLPPSPCATHDRERRQCEAARGGYEWLSGPWPDRASRPRGYKTYNRAANACLVSRTLVERAAAAVLPSLHPLPPSTASPAPLALRRPSFPVRLLTVLRAVPPAQCDAPVSPEGPTSPLRRRKRVAPHLLLDPLLDGRRTAVVHHEAVGDLCGRGWGVSGGVARRHGRGRGAHLEEPQLVVGYLGEHVAHFDELEVAAADLCT